MIRGDRLKQLRLQKGLTQTELGNLVNVTKVSICGYEKNNKIPNLETLSDLCEILNTKITYILGVEMNVVAEDDSSYNYTMSSDEIKLIQELRKNKNLYQKMMEDPKRVIELINLKI